MPCVSGKCLTRSRTSIRRLPSAPFVALTGLASCVREPSRVDRRLVDDAPRARRRAPSRPPASRPLAARSTARGASAAAAGTRPCGGRRDARGGRLELRVDALVAPRGRTGSADGTSSRGGLRISDGGRPGIGTSGSSRGRSRRGIDLQQAPRVGVLGRREDRLRVGVLDDPPGVHHGDVVGHLGDDAEVVGDHHDRRVELAAQALDAARGSAPGPSRRAPSSARRRSAASGR